MPRPDFATLMREVLNEEEPPERDVDMDERILDATLAVIGEYGERKLTIDDVAARAKVARATIFRRFGSRDDLVVRFYMREVRRARDEVRDAIAGARNAEEAMAAGYVALVMWVAGHAVIQQLARAEPDTMVELWREGEPTGLSVIQALLAGIVLGRDDADGVDRRALTELCDRLARLMFSRLVLAGDLKKDLKSDRALVSLAIGSADQSSSGRGGSGRLARSSGRLESAGRKT